MIKKSLQNWLDYQLELYTQEIELGLERVKKVAAKLGILNPNFKIITIGGTNGKGSTVTLTESILRQSGFKTGAFTSPHLLRYTERIKINHQEITESELIEHFELIEKIKGDVKVTYFEFACLSAMLSFIRHKVDVAILEVGLGGRLDATNIWDADVSVVTSVDVDHQKWLGDTKEEISREKAGIFKKDKLAIVGDKNPSKSLIEQAYKVRAILKIHGVDFRIDKKVNGWDLHFDEKKLTNLAWPGLAGDFQLSNAACAILAVASLNFDIHQPQINCGLQKAKIVGRLQRLEYLNRNWLLDVAHNPHSAKVLAKHLAKNKPSGKTFALFAMLEDKNIEQVIKIMQVQIDTWYVLNLEIDRAVPGNKIHSLLAEMAQEDTRVYNKVEEAVKTIIEDSTVDDRIIVFGSFYTVAEVLRLGIGDNV